MISRIFLVHTTFFCEVINYIIFHFSNIVPASTPEDVTIQLYNSTSALIMWGPPNKRELHGDLQGYKVIIRSQNTSHYWNNFTLDSDITSLLLENLTAEEVYWVKVAAYNRKGIGPFSKVVELKVRLFKL